jgi:hypothetical protein
VIGAEDEGHRIEEIDGRLGGVGAGFTLHHSLRIPTPARRAERASRKSAPGRFMQENCCMRRAGRLK